MYRCEATSVTGFIQQLACVYLRSGYVRAACGILSEGKNAAAFDRKQIERYALDTTTARMRWQRSRSGLARIQYLRHDRVFVILATDGEDEVFEREEGRIVRDLRARPLLAFGYSIRMGSGHVQVRIADTEYRAFAAEVLHLASRERTADKIACLFRRLPYEAYAPVRGQLFGLLAAVNTQRRRAGLEPVSGDVIRSRRRLVKPFGPSLTHHSQCNPK